MSIADDLRNRIGFTRRDDRGEAQAFMQELSRRIDPEARLAAGLAQALVPTDRGRRADPDGLVRLAVPDLKNDPRPLPTDPDMRRRHIATAVLASAERHVRDGSDEGLVPELGRAARRETVRGLTLGDVRRSGIDAALKDRGETKARTVAAYLSNGTPIQEHMGKLLEEIPKRGETPRTLERLRDNREFHSARQPAGGPDLKTWVRQGLDAERAAARAGLLAPAPIVRIAEETMKGADVERLSTLGRARPDFVAAAELDPAGRQKAFTASMTMMKASPQSGFEKGREDIARPPADRQVALQAQVAQIQQNQR